MSTRATRSARLRWRLGSIALATLIGGLGLAFLAEADAPLPLDHDDFGRNRSKNINATDSDSSKRDAGEKPVSAFSHPGQMHVDEKAAPAPAWIAINRPFELYGLEVPEVAKLSKNYEALRHRTGGGRQDILTFGSLKPDNAYFRLILYRRGSEDAPNVPFFVELARRAADGDLSITKSVPPVSLATRFGEAEVADVILTAAEGTSLPCFGIRIQAKTLAWRITGFACGGAKPLPRQALQCIFDRLDLNTAGDDRALADFFAETELRRNPACAGTRLTPTTARAAWLDDKETAAPPKPPKPSLQKH